MPERTVTIQHRQSQDSLAVVVKTAERAGRWIARLAPAEPPANPQDWPGIAAEDKTQRVWVGESEAEAVEVALNWLRSQYLVTA